MATCTEGAAPPAGRGYRNLLDVHFGDLVVTAFAGRVKGQAMWTARCTCGSVYDYQAGNLMSGRSRGCRKCVPKKVAKHGMCGTPEYMCWHNMLQRCESPKNPQYHYYGGRGIRVCERWRKSFDAFLADMGRKPSPELSIDRIDNDGNYEPSNCRWATRAEQSTNKRNGAAVLEHNGRRMTILDWARELGMSRQAVHIRLKKYPIDVALSVPKQSRRPLASS